jgi:hypothetical protein
MRPYLFVMLAGSLALAACSGSNGISHTYEPEEAPDAGDHGGHPAPDGGEPDAMAAGPSVTDGANEVMLQVDTHPGDPPQPGDNCFPSQRRYYLYLDRSSLEAWTCAFDGVAQHYAPKSMATIALTSAQRAQVDGVLATLKPGLAPMTCDSETERSLDVSHTGAAAITYYGSDYECGRSVTLQYVRVSLAPLETLFAQLTGY